MTARPSAETLTSGTRGLSPNRDASDGRSTTMTTSIAIIILVILDIYLLHELDKHETAIVALLKKNGMITEVDDD
jgi:hypothetical protein